ncbi:hypothetical protein Dsin_018096 [Dipteronia sinensis]|uniref:Uncharacterized protein n=1 Tax=Dipteronia sinensis TaxID=43782 RepID=A0AAE0AGD3_9ROSI|nr:hypothetical protein Dsin_018096 [Dipteronia sinensis]
MKLSQIITIIHKPSQRPPSNPCEIPTLKRRNPVKRATVSSHRRRSELLTVGQVKELMGDKEERDERENGFFYEGRWRGSVKMKMITLTKLVALEIRWRSLDK